MLEGSECVQCGFRLPADFTKAPHRNCLPSSLAYIADKLNGQYLWRCRNCQWHTFTPTDEPLEHTCGSPKVTRLGDRIEAALKVVGVTQDLWQEAKAAVGLPPGCNCDGRRLWLNKLDASLKLGERVQLFKTALGWKDS